MENLINIKESSHGLSKLSMDRLFVQASKQWLRSRDAPKETRKTRIIRWLHYRGFSWDVISSIVKRLESSDPT
ncbi:Regulatory protein [Trema orientale]|uniref:Regulatory protein RecX n=1 Tax=Trema orientale TaxID=63057 RepID=A0A2P5CLI2_TREOI|nr:Regulatory protein [Trema orientale]